MRTKNEVKGSKELTNGGSVRAAPSAVFPLGRFFSANQQFVGAWANNYWEYGKHCSRKLDKLVEIWHLVYFNTRLVQKFGHIHVFLELWAQLLQENLGTGWFAIKLEGTVFVSLAVASPSWKIQGRVVGLSKPTVSWLTDSNCLGVTTRLHRQADKHTINSWFFGTKAQRLPLLWQPIWACLSIIFAWGNTRCRVLSWCPMLSLQRIVFCNCPAATDGLHNHSQFWVLSLSRMNASNKTPSAAPQLSDLRNLLAKRWWYLTYRFSTNASLLCLAVADKLQTLFCTSLTSILSKWHFKSLSHKTPNFHNPETQKWDVASMKIANHAVQTIAIVLCRNVTVQHSHTNI